MKKIAVIQDLSGLGKCSLTAAIPVLSVMGSAGGTAANSSTQQPDRLSFLLL